jgi:hypothetical protein
MASILSRETERLLAIPAIQEALQRAVDTKEPQTVVLPDGRTYVIRRIPL